MLSRWQTRPSNAFMVANLMVGLYFLVIWTAKWIFLGRMNAYELEKFREKARLERTRASPLYIHVHLDGCSTLWPMK